MILRSPYVVITKYTKYRRPSNKILKQLGKGVVRKGSYFLHFHYEKYKGDSLDFYFYICYLKSYLSTKSTYDTKH